MPPKKASAAAPAKPDEQQLGMKDQTLFKQVLRFYETKQYKKAIKSADAILKKNPNHGETLAMKGLTYNSLRKKEEAHALIKRGLAMNIKSHICWHVYGLLYRSETKYDDAIKCYQNALKRDVENLQIMKDLSNLQIQRRMLAGFTETRRRILQLKSNNRHNWLAYAIGNHLTGDYAKALSILDTLQNTAGMGQRAPNDKRPPQYEESEMHLYRATILEEAGRYAEAVSYLQDNMHEIIDRMYVKEEIGRLHLRLGDRAAAEKEYRVLLEWNPENYAYHVGLQKSLGFIPAEHEATKSFLGVEYTPEQSAALLKLYEEDPIFRPQPPSTSVPSSVRRIPLYFTSGPTFRSLIAQYIRDKISRGIPSLFSDLETLYADADKRAAIGEVIEEMLPNLRDANRYAPADAKDSESPSSLMYALHFAAQHYDHLNDNARALALVNESIVHTPTPPDSYMLKARIYKHAGDPVTAYGYMEQARRLDTQDRYLNVKCVRYALRADQLSAAENTVLLFLRDGDGLGQLEELQVCWYENCAAELHMRARSWGRALKKLVAIHKHFTDMLEDQFDFHQYCLRKSTLRAYVDTIRWGNVMRGHRFHVRAALNLVRVYLRLYDEPREEAAQFEAMARENQLTDAERKEEQKRQKKAAAKARAAEEKASAAEAAAKLAAQKGKQQTARKEDPDPDGAELVKAEPLAEATKFLQFLAAHHASALDTHTLAVAVYVRKQRFLLALRHVRKALAIDATHPDTHVALAAFLHALREAGVRDALPPLVREVIDEAVASAPLGAGADVAALNAQYLSVHGAASLAARLGGARVLLLLDPIGNKVEAQKLAAQIRPEESFTRTEAADSLAFLTDTVRAPADVIDAFKSAALKRFPLCVAFGAVPAPPPPIDAPAAKE